ncbi:NADPH-dependent F420 reductase [Maribellus sediminis]|uniref:NADPH-dependent F420 reductase n=1 Tax=Maribellus sediminis TaxID=2696285 RepID=UPI00197D1C96|nr:NAD(P)-binding domain-containing protein [Maribellus sediminis]
MKSVGIIGSGNVGRALAHGFIKYGYSTMISSRNGETRKKLKDEFEDKLSVDTPENVSEQCEILVFAVKGNQAKEALTELGVSNLKGKTIIDTTNPIEDSAPENGVLRYTTSINKSLMEELQEIAPEAHFVKAFSCVGSLHMVDPKFESTPTMFICGNDPSAKLEVKEIIDQFGWEVEDMGAAEAARAIEPLAILWCIPGFIENSWNHALKLLKK